MGNEADETTDGADLFTAALAAAEREDTVDLFTAALVAADREDQQTR